MVGAFDFIEQCADVVAEAAGRPCLCVMTLAEG
jgi:hypothetical protein